MNQAFPKRLRRILANNVPLYVLMLPAIVTTFVFSYIPMYGVQIAFKNFRTSLGIWDSPWVGFEHFIRFVTYPNFWSLLSNTLSITLYSLATFPLPLVIALMIHEIKNQKFKKTVQMISYAPHFLSVVVIVGMLRLFFDRGNGIVNNVIAVLGGTRVDFISSPNSFSSLYVWSGVWQNIGWGTIIYLAALSGVSQELIEAAKIDGARRTHIMRYVNIPAILPTVIILFIMRTGSLLSLGFEKILLMQNDLNREATQVVSSYVYQIGLKQGQFSYASAIGLFNNVVNVTILILVNKISKRVSEVSLW